MTPSKQVQSPAHPEQTEFHSSTQSQPRVTVAQSIKLNSAPLFFQKTQIGELPKGVFSRPGKELRSEVILAKGCILNLRSFVKQILPYGATDANNYIITDSVVDQLYGELVVRSFIDAGISVKKIVIPVDVDNIEDEIHKSTDVLMRCCDEILESRISKTSCIISLGGGVINNIAGVIASLLYRGIGLIHIPTTMMAMIDAAIDFKQAVNHTLGKNLIGSYYPASYIVIDPCVLETLSNRHILNGLSEGIKHGFTQSKAILDDIVLPLKDNYDVNIKNMDYLTYVCQKVIELKIQTLINYHDSDYNEMCPQYGHAVGHAIEHLSQHDERHQTLYHGEAIAIGMCISAEISYLLGLCKENVVEDHYRLMIEARLPVYIPSTLSIECITKKLMYDKHYLKAMYTGLVSEIGQMAVNDGESYSWRVEKNILEEALLRNICRRDKASFKDASA